MLTENKKEDIIHTMWVIVEKEKEGKVIRKARLCAKGFQETTEVRTDSPTVSKQALRVAIAVTVAKGWKICSVDAKSAFLQGTNIEREVFVKPPKEFKRKFGKALWRLRKVLYGLKDAPRAWYVRVDQFLKSLGCKAVTVEPALYYFAIEDRLEGVIATHVDDFYMAGTERFHRQVVSKLMSEFVVGELKTKKFVFCGWNLEQKEDGSIKIDIAHAIDNLEDK